MAELSIGRDPENERRIWISVWQNGELIALPYDVEVGHSATITYCDGRRLYLQWQGTDAEHAATLAAGAEQRAINDEFDEIVADIDLSEGDK